jgi:hypothetical protein
VFVDGGIGQVGKNVPGAGQVKLLRAEARYAFFMNVHLHNNTVTKWGMCMQLLLY